MKKTNSEKSVNAIRMLSIDAINKANSGHPGICMGAAPMLYTLWTKHLNITPKNSTWINRDRFILSAGHGSAMLYSTLHLSGYNVSIDDLKKFRQYKSNTPGHPELGWTDGVDATTGPLGQGFAMGVGEALAEAHLATKYNKEGLNIFDHYTYVLCGDGDLMEGVASEAASFAGHMKLGKLIVLFDSNDISLDGDLNISYTEKTMDRFKAYGWETLRVNDGENIDDINKAIEKAKKNLDQPTIIEVKTKIGFGSPSVEGTAAAHGAPLGDTERDVVAKNYNWDFAPFEIDQDVYEDFKNTTVKNGDEALDKWNDVIFNYKNNYADDFEVINKIIHNEVVDFESIDWLNFDKGTKMATRVASHKAINSIANTVPNFVGGSADLSKSNNTTIDNSDKMLSSSMDEKNIYFGVREFAMGAILNGMSAHAGLKVFGGTFFVFSDYLKAAIRMSAIMHQPVVYVLTHDSVAVGEDGPTHEPVEQLAGLRATPNLNVVRPADANEAQAAWKIALEQTSTPTALILSRQDLEVFTEKFEEVYNNLKTGAYVVCEDEKFDYILMATGSEVNLALKVKKAMNEQGKKVRVVSMPCWELFEKQTEEYKNNLLPKEIRKRISLEVGSELGWHKYVGLDGVVISINTFGESAPGNTVIEHFGFSPEIVVEKINNVFK